MGADVPCTGGAMRRRLKNLWITFKNRYLWRWCRFQALEPSPQEKKRMLELMTPTTQELRRLQHEHWDDDWTDIGGGPPSDGDDQIQHGSSSWR